MFDVAQKDDMFGYIHTNPQNGAIAEVGTMCKITERQLLDDGRQFIAVKGVSRFRVNKIAKTLPYVLAEVEPFEGDDEVAEEVVAPLEVEVYNYLKYYLRLLGSHDKSKNIVISQSTKQHRPASGSAGALMGVADQSARRTAFSFSLANMIQMQQPRESQLLLQTTSIVKRLKVQKQILIQASKLISEQLIKMGSLTEEEREDIRIRSFREDDDDTDIMPDEEVEEKMEEEKDEWDISNIE